MSKRTWRILVGALVISAVSPVITASSSADAATPTCGGRRATIVGTANDDVINGTAGNDVIVALGGRDLVRGRGGNDTICGGAGADRLRGGPGGDLLLGGAGRDDLRGGRGQDELRGGGGNDLLDGGLHVDSLDGGPGRDSCYRTTAARLAACEKDQLWTGHWKALQQPGDVVSHTEAASGSAPMALDVPKLANRRFLRSVGCTFVDAPGDSCDWRFILPDGATRFAARVGGDPRFTTGTVARYQLIGDGKVIASRVVGVGEIGTIKASIAGVDYLILRIRHHATAAPPAATEFHLWADPRIGYNGRLSAACAIVPATSGNRVPTCRSEL